VHYLEHTFLLSIALEWVYNSVKCDTWEQCKVFLSSNMWINSVPWRLTCQPSFCGQTQFCVHL
jgi:hypothetical protein